MSQSEGNIIIYNDAWLEAYLKYTTGSYVIDHNFCMLSCLAENFSAVA